MSLRVILICILASVGACTPDARTASQVQSVARSLPASALSGPSEGEVGAPHAFAPAAPVADSASIAGEWDVVSFEGYEPRRLSGTKRAAFADFGERGVGLRIECNYSGRAGIIQGGRFIASSDNDRAQTAMSCGPERNDRESRFFAFFDKSPTIERIDADRLRLKVNNLELLLARPKVHRLKFVPTFAELQGRWRLLEVTRYLPAGGFSGIGLSEVPGRIVVSGDRLSYSRCPQYGLSFRYGADGKLEKTGGTAPPAAPATCRELAEPARGRELPAQWDTLHLLHANPMVERSGDAVLISTDRLGLLLTKAPCESLEQSDDHRTSRTVDCASPE